MSLRSKIILLFVGLDIVPLLTLAAFSYWQAQNILVSTVQGHLNETAITLSRRLEARGSEIDQALEELAGSPLLNEVQEDDVADGDFSALLGPRLGQAVFLEVSDASGSARMLIGSIPEEAVRLRTGESSGLLEFTKSLPGTGRPGILRVGFWASDLISREGRSLPHSVVLLDAANGEVLFTDGPRALRAGDHFETFPGFSPATAAPGPPSGTFEFRDAGEVRLGAFSLVADKGWTIVATSSSSTALASLNRLVTAYWAFVLGLALFTALAFYLLLGRVTKSLRDLTRAAEHIGTGELDPWLPLPASGEVGQLTLAFNRMLERIKGMMNQVDQSGRLAVVGQLSAYFAHEIRNPLTSIKLNLQRLRRWTHQGKMPEFCLEPLEISLREVERLSASVSDVLQLSRSQDSPRDVFSLHHQVEDSAHLLLARFMGQGVELRLDLDAEADLVLARPGQVKSVILNLMVNALEAQPKGGYLEIRSELTRSQSLGGPAVSLRFKDGGPGVPPEVRDRVFEPFFTTKAGGSGIGLAVANRAVQDNHGHLYLEATPSGKAGAEFVMALPLAAIDPDSVPVGHDSRPVRGNRSPQDRKEPLMVIPGSSETGHVPAHLMTPEGVKAVMALSLSDPEDVN